jgi:hypothetical protein
MPEKPRARAIPLDFSGLTACMRRTVGRLRERIGSFSINIAVFVLLSPDRLNP